MNMIYIDLKDDLSEKMVYDYPDCPAYTIHEMLSHYPNYSAISHWHDDIEFLMIQSGQMQYNVNSWGAPCTFLGQRKNPHSGTGTGDFCKFQADALRIF